MQRRTLFLLILALVVVAGSFLLGFWPQYQRAEALEANFEKVRARTLELDGRLANAKARDAASLMLLEVTKKNFGVAGGHASDMFNRIRQLHDSSQQPETKTALAAILSRRDEVIGMLGKGDPAVEGPVREIVEQVHKAIGR